MKPLLFIVAAALATPAIAQTVTQPSLAEIIAGLEAKGYRVTDVDVDRNDLEVEAMTHDGRAVELWIDRASGEITSEHADD